jgi:hypothetical protein
MMAGKSKIDEDCEQLRIVADPWNLKLKPAKLKGDPKLTLEKEREILSIVEQLYAMLRGRGKGRSHSHEKKRD